MSADKRLWLQPDDIEFMMEDELRKAGLFPSVDRPVVEIEAFIERHLRARMDQYAELEDGVLGQTEFVPGQPPKVEINRDLTGAVDDDDSAVGAVGRWRATFAHEASHVVIHRVLFELDDRQGALFGNVPASPTPSRLMRCLKKNVLFRAGGSDWKEVQANRGMAALLMPRPVFRELAVGQLKRVGVSGGVVMIGSLQATRIASEIASAVKVSGQAAAIRLETLGLAVPAQQGRLTGNG